MIRRCSLAVEAAKVYTCGLRRRTTGLYFCSFTIRHDGSGVSFPQQASRLQILLRVPRAVLLFRLSISLSLSVVLLSLEFGKTTDGTTMARPSKKEPRAKHHTRGDGTTCMCETRRVGYTKAAGTRRWVFHAKILRKTTLVAADCIVAVTASCGFFGATMLSRSLSRLWRVHQPPLWRERKSIGNRVCLPLRREARKIRCRYFNAANYLCSLV